MMYSYRYFCIHFIIFHIFNVSGYLVHVFLLRSYDVHVTGLSAVVSKVKFSLYQTTKAQRVSRGIALPFHDLGA